MPAVGMVNTSDAYAVSKTAFPQYFCGDRPPLPGGRDEARRRFAKTLGYDRLPGPQPFHCRSGRNSWELVSLARQETHQAAIAEPPMRVTVQKDFVKFGSDP